MLVGPNAQLFPEMCFEDPPFTVTQRHSPLLPIIDHPIILPLTHLPSPSVTHHHSQSFAVAQLSLLPIYCHSASLTIIHFHLVSHNSPFYQCNVTQRHSKSHPIICRPEIHPFTHLQSLSVTHNSPFYPFTVTQRH